MNQMAAAPSVSKIRKKYQVEVELVMSDGDTIGGMVFVLKEERVLDLLNNGLPFFPLRLANREIILIRKEAIAVCKPLDRPG